VHDKWAIVLDEAWLAFKDKAPNGLRVQIRDGPGDEAASKSQIIALCLDMGVQGEGKLMSSQESDTTLSEQRGLLASVSWALYLEYGDFST
jgi:hypothetical protein